MPGGAWPGGLCSLVLAPALLPALSAPWALLDWKPAATAGLSVMASSASEATCRGARKTATSVCHDCFAAPLFAHQTALAGARMVALSASNVTQARGLKGTEGVHVRLVISP